MKKILSFVTSTALLFMLTNTFADSKIISTDSFATVKQLIEQNKHPHHLLLALDDDDTLTMMPCPSPSHCQYLGGPAWYNWQSKLPAGDTDRVWQTFPQLLAINNLLMVMSQMPLVDPQTPSTLQAADNRGAFIVVASARGSDMSNATETQFQQDGIFNLIKQAAIKTPTGHTSFPGEYLPDSWQDTPVRPIEYLDGTLYLAGQNKGIMLKQFLAKTNQTDNIQTIIFVDDSYQNVVDVANAYANDSSAKVISIYYTKLKEHKAAFLTGKNAKKLQAIANHQWGKISKVAQKELLGFDV